MDEPHNFEMPTEESEKKRTAFNWKWFVLLCVLVIGICVVLIFQSPVSSTTLIFRDGMVLNPVECENFNKTTFFFSPSCSACEGAVQDIGKLETEHNKTFDIHYMDITKNETLDFLSKRGYVISQIPVLVDNCTIYVGRKGIEEYRVILKVFIN